MNKERRNTIREAITHVRDALRLVEEARDGEQEAFDNMPECLQQSEKGEAMESVISELDDAFSYLESVEMNLETAIGE